MTKPLYEITSHIEGKNAKVRVYPEYVEWERGKSVSGAKVTAAILTGGMSAAATGLRTRKNAGTETIFMRSITSVTTKRDSFANDVVKIVASGNTIDMRCSRAEAQRLKQLIQDGIAGRLEQPVEKQQEPAPTTTPVVLAETAPTPAAAPATPPPPPPADAPAAAWFPDPKKEARLRYWDGAAWTEHTAP